jgi:hypothetical protein
MKTPEVGARNCDWSYESLVCQKTNFIELKVSASSHEDATNLSGREPAQLWQFYIQLVEIEAASKT